MGTRALYIVFPLLGLCLNLLSIDAFQKPLSNITVVGSVYCDACSNNTFSKHSFFLKGVKVLIQCQFKVKSGAAESISLEAERTTDQYGIYKLNIPPVDGLNCIEGHAVMSTCRASLINNPSPNCNIPGMKGSTQHLAIRSRDPNICFLNLNAMNYRPAKRNKKFCGSSMKAPNNGFSSSMMFWPYFPLFWPPWLSYLPPFVNPPSIPFDIPEWLLQFLRPPFFPFPLFQAPSPPYKP
ncbi:Pollen-specific protein-like protein [Carex littledalei]|uniref:Pollen-specific protein-like protein n=1 Tax=Carex littledalei TaxID=544730 RepID=A0A833R1D7_9POAL|nr:Pollen-specific protein-like protein [Carex littledalei]